MSMMTASLRSAFQEKGGFDMAVFRKQKNNDETTPVLAGGATKSTHPFSIIDSYVPFNTIQEKSARPSKPMN